jgi:hypothetical protein
MMNSTLSMHAARSALNRDPDLRDWAEQWLKDRERIGREDMTTEEFDKYWRYVKPERMHEGAIEAVTAYLELHGAR